ALPATTRDAVFVSRRALAVAVGRHGQDEFFLLGQRAERVFLKTLRKLTVAPEIGVSILAVFLAGGLLIGEPAGGGGGLKILLAKLALGIDMGKDRHGDHFVTLGEPDAAHAERRASGEHANGRHRKADRLARTS